MGRTCKTCRCVVHPIEVKVPGTLYPGYKCPVCGAEISMGRTKFVALLIGILVVIWAIASVF